MKDKVLNGLIDMIIYTCIYFVSAVILLFIEIIVSSKEEISFLIMFRIISLVIDFGLWILFEKMRNHFIKQKKWPKYWANILAFIVVIQIPYIIRLFIFRSHFGPLEKYFLGVILSAFILGHIMPIIKDDIKSKIPIVKKKLLRKLNAWSVIRLRFFYFL